MAADGPLRVAAYPVGRPGQSNPYSALFSAALRAQGATVDDLRFGMLFRSHYDVVHLHWPEWTLDARSTRRPLTMLAALAWARRRGTKVVWTVHNLGHHERTERRREWAWSRFVRMVDGFVSLTEGGVDDARQAFPALEHVPARVVRHGHYRDVYDNTTTRDEARDALGIARSATVCLFFGQVRPYKGVVELVRTFRTIADRNSVLVVAGRPVDDALATAVTRATEGDDRIRVHLGLVPVEDVQRYLNAADVVALPYVESFNSGAALLALSFDRPVLAPATGAFAELADTLGPRWVTTYDGALDADTLERVLGEAHDRQPAVAPLDAFSWREIGRATNDFYRSLLNSTARSAR